MRISSKSLIHFVIDEFILVIYNELEVINENKETLIKLRSLISKQMLNLVEF